MQAVAEIAPLEATDEEVMMQQHKSQHFSFFDMRTLQKQHPRPSSHASDDTDMFDTDFEEEQSDSEEEEFSVKRSFESEDGRRRSMTTLSSIDEAPTPSPRISTGTFELRIKPVEGPRGPHLFRASTVSAEYNFEHALQMSPLVTSKPADFRTSNFFDEVVSPVLEAAAHADPALAAALRHSRVDFELRQSQEHLRDWTPEQVVAWLGETGIDEGVIECFQRHDISGAVVVDLEFEDLKELGIVSFGKRHQLWNAICLLRGEDVRSPAPEFDGSRPGTAASSHRRSSTQRNVVCETPVDQTIQTTEPPSSGKRRGRKPSDTIDVVMPGESVSIVAIEQLVPKPHKCAKGEQCSKWQRQQREYQRLESEHGFSCVSAGQDSPRVIITGSPGNPENAENLTPSISATQQQQQQHQQQTLLPSEPPTPFRPVSVVVPSIVASSDLLGPGLTPRFNLQQGMLEHLGARDPQDNVKQFLTFQHMQPASPVPTMTDDLPPTSPPLEMFPSDSVAAFPARNLADHHHQQQQQQQHSQSHPRRSSQDAPSSSRPHLPRLDIPRAATTSPSTTTNPHPAPINYTLTISPIVHVPPPHHFRAGTPASEMDVPYLATPMAPAPARDTSQSVPPNMHYRPQRPLARTLSRNANTTPSTSSTPAPDWRRPSMTHVLPALKENEVLTTSTSSTSHTSNPSTATTTSPSPPTTKTHILGYGDTCTHSGFMKKRKTRLLRHEWQEAHFRLKGTQLAMHANALSSLPLDTINVDDYAVACNSLASSSKFAAAMKALHISSDASDADKVAAFAFQLVPQGKDGGEKKQFAVLLGNGGAKTHHFAVKGKDDRIDWMRELMLAKALQQKREGFEVEVNGVVQK